MKNISLFYILIISILSINFIDAQSIKDDAYKNLYLKEDFNMPGDYFPIVTTNENYFIIDDGDYLMSRNNNESEYEVIANWRKKSYVFPVNLKSFTFNFLKLQFK